MAAKVYVETTFVSYLTARPSRDVVIAGHQQITHQWWESSRHRFELCTSQLVIEEAGAADPSAAQERLAILGSLTSLGVTTEARDLAKLLVEAGAVPEQAKADAAHIAIAATQGIDYLLTWNCRHLANAAMRKEIETVCNAAGYKPPIICTPEELLED
jgi:hypothetical protein